MVSVVFATVARILLPVFLLFSSFLFLRGHNAPGGGFAGGLVAATAFACYRLAYDSAATRRLLGVAPQTLINAGLLLMAGSAVWPLTVGDALMTGQWISMQVSFFGEIHLGTPLVFDLGVYLTVVGVLLTIFLTLTEE